MDVRCDVCFQRVALTGKKSKRGPDKVSHHYRPGMGVCAGSYATPTDAMRAEGEYRDGRTVYRGVAGYTVVTGTGAVDAVVTEEHATSDAAWSALVDELRAKGRAR